MNTLPSHPDLVRGLLLFLLTALSACGARSGLRVGASSEALDATASSEVREPGAETEVTDAPEVMDTPEVMDAPDVRDAPDVMDTPDVMDAPEVMDAPDVRDAPDVMDISEVCIPVASGCGAVERCGNGLDDDCNGRVDETCVCDPGAVQPCFPGPPGRRDLGVCHDGTQTCEMASRRWGECLGGISPRPDTCNGADNLCNGCSARVDCEIMCPGADDPRVRDGAPFRDYALRGEDFFPAPARLWRWSIQGGPCDRASRVPSFDLLGENLRDATFVPKLSGDYTVTLTVTSLAGRVFTCTWIVHIEGPGLRVEMCYPENETLDLDLFVHRPGSRASWYPLGRDVFQPTADACGWHNCEANLRGASPDGGTVPRADWGYPTSPLSECLFGPQGDRWRMLGGCSNPRLDIDNNLSKAIGVPENINIDRPRDGETFRVMVHNFSGALARPLVNIYCSGRRTATYGASPDIVPRFTGDMNPSVGAMWRVVDVTTRVDAAGRTRCVVNALHPPGSTAGYDVSYNDPRY